MSSNDHGKLSPLTTHWHNRSLSSVKSATTFHSAHAHMELSPLSTAYPQSAISMPTPLSPSPAPMPVLSPEPEIAPSSPKSAPSSPKIKSEKMSRHDSGFASASLPPSQSSSRRTSSSSTRPKRNSTSTSTRPSQKRSSRSSQTTARTSLSSQSQRPAMRTRHTAPSSSFPTSTPTLPSSQARPRPQTPYTHQFFHFPSLPTCQTPQKEPPPPPPSTVQYWTSDTTRRMEYAAIDAASRGMRGFFIRLVPDCILPAGSRRTKFHCDSREDDDSGSVRRYRLTLAPETPRPEEKGDENGRPKGMLRRWTSLSFGRRS